MEVSMEKSVEIGSNKNQFDEMAMKAVCILKKLGVSEPTLDIVAKELSDKSKSEPESKDEDKAEGDVEEESTDSESPKSGVIVMMKSDGTKNEGESLYDRLKKAKM